MDGDIELQDQIDEIENLGDGSYETKVAEFDRNTKGKKIKHLQPSIRRTLRSFALRIEFNVLWEELTIDCCRKPAEAITYMTALVLFASSTYDVVADGLVAESFITGTNYTKIVTDQGDPFVMSDDCFWIATNIYIDHRNENDTIKSFQYDCFEKDPFWGAWTLSFMFTPGFPLFMLIADNLKQTGAKKILVTMLMLLLIPLFPVLLIVVKFLAIFHHGIELKKLDAMMTLCEGQFESFFQVGLQTYIIFLRADREPSSIQMISLPISLLMIIVGQANTWYEKEPVSDLIQDIKRKVFLSPLLLMLNVGFLGVSVVILVINEWVFLGNLAAMVLVLLMIICSSSKSVIKGFVAMHIWFLALIIWSIVEVNIHREKYSGISIVEMNYFNTIAGIIVGVGFLPGITFVLNFIYCLLSYCFQHSQLKSRRKGGNYVQPQNNSQKSKENQFMAPINIMFGINNLQKIKLKSTNSRPYKCDFGACHYRFETKPHLLKHIGLSHHIKAKRRQSV